MVSAAGSIIHYADSGDLWSYVICEGGNIREKQSKGKWLKKYIKLGNRVPDVCMFWNMIWSLDTKQRHTVFVEWMKNAVEHMTGVGSFDLENMRQKTLPKNHLLFPK